MFYIQARDLCVDCGVECNYENENSALEKKTTKKHFGGKHISL